MVLRKLHISNYKIFKGEHSVRFPEGNKPAVFIGVNGAGKTTIIEAITGCLWDFYLKIQGKQLCKNERFNKSNINVYADEFSKVSLNWKSNYSEDLETGFEISKTLNPEYKLIGRDKLADYISNLKGEAGYYKNEVSVDIVVYYPVERTVLNPSLKSKSIGKNNQFDAFENAFDSSINFTAFFDWFRSAEDLENEMRLNKEARYSDKGLNAVRDAILIFLENYTKIRVRRTSPSAELILEKSGKEFNINQLSHGEKALIAMVGDLARRLVIANPGLKNPLNGRGVVMIDELDLHLHPKWQKSILGKLVKTFPNIQFICTTHSSLVINHLDKESVFLLENARCYTLTERYRDFNSYGADIEDILKIVQDTGNILPQDIKEQFDELHQKIESNNIEEARAIINALKEKTDPNQPELQKAETQIKYKQLLNQ